MSGGFPRGSSARGQPDRSAGLEGGGQAPAGAGADGDAKKKERLQQRVEFFSGKKPSSIK